MQSTSQPHIVNKQLLSKNTSVLFNNKQVHLNMMLGLIEKLFDYYDLYFLFPNV